MKGPPLSGSESKFTNRRWGTKTGIGNNNCYAYAVGDYEAYRWQKSIPGDRSGLSNGTHNYTHCTGLPNRVISDNPKKVYKIGPNEKCKKGYYKVMMFVSPGGPPITSVKVTSIFTAAWCRRIQSEAGRYYRVCGKIL